MPDINGIPYVESTDLVSAYPAASQALAQEISDQLASKLSATAPVGKILQVVSTTKTDTFSVSAASAAITDVTGLSLSITPTAATSKILLFWSVSGDAANVGWATVVKRNGTGIGLGDAATSRTQVTDLGIMSGATTDQNAVGTGHYLDAPATTSAITYQIALFNQRASTQVLSVNLTGNDGANAYIARSASTITALEIGA